MSASDTPRTASPAQSDALYHLAHEWMDLHQLEGDLEGEEGERGGSDNESDIDYQESSIRSEDIEFIDEEDEEEDDAIRQPLGVQFTIQPGDPGRDTAGSESDGTDGQNDLGEGRTRITTGQLMRLLGANGLRRILQSQGLLSQRLPHGNNDDDDEGDVSYSLGSHGFRRRRRQRPSGDLYPKIPSEAGKKLMASGVYGSNQYYVDRVKQRKKRLATKLMWRELGLGPQYRHPQAISQSLIPSSTADKIIHYDSRCYSGQFSDDGNFFFSCSQDFKVRMYDTSNPYDWKYYKTVNYPFGQWTITDASLSPDNRFLAYSSIKNVVCLASTDPSSESDPTLLSFDRTRRRDGPVFPYSSHFGIWSIRFSGDGREIVAGTSEGSVIVYDVETRQPVLRLQKHSDDVNAVCFGDKSSPHILYSGSDDTTIRVWDRRSMGDGRAAGGFMGHTEGLTYVDSKGDGRYVLSNGKDQTMKLWDLRKMMTTSQFDDVDPERYSSGFDYRFMSFADEDYQPHPHDCSVVTFRGHSVLKTLIRCHFSPPGSTNSRYVYSGSEDGKVYVYNLDATIAGIIDVEKASYNTRPRDIEQAAYGGEIDWHTCVRDASWHPNAPIVAATSWNGWSMSSGTCSTHSWNDNASEDEGDPPMGKNYDSTLEPLPLFDRHAEQMR